MMSDPNPLKRRAHQVRTILSDVIRSLRFYADMGYDGEDCSDVNLARIRLWSDPECLRAHDNSTDREAGPDACGSCPLRAGKRPVIAGEGPAVAKLMFVMGYPSFPAETEYTPYAGEAGQLLARIVSAMKLKPEDVCVTHIVKCRPPEGKAPLIEETRRCSAFLEREIKLVKPEVICAFGEFAARYLLGSSEPLDRLRGRFYERFGARIIFTWHPDDMIKDPDKKRPVWEDIRKVMRCLDIS